MLNALLALLKTGAICLSSTAIIGGVVIVAGISIILLCGVATYRIAAAAQNRRNFNAAKKYIF